MNAAFLAQVSGTLVLWAISATAALALAAVLAAGSLNRIAPSRALANFTIMLSRGVPTSLLIVTAGIAAIPHAPPKWLPNLFPGTSPGMALVAWALTLALAVGSAGHLAVILRTGYLALGMAKLEQATALGLAGLARFRLLLRESAAATLAPVGARLVHHLHNTAFAALFPVAEAFGWVEDRANETFDVTRYAAVGASVYVLLSLLIWSVTRGLEYRIVRQRSASLTPRDATT